MLTSSDLECLLVNDGAPSLLLLNILDAAHSNHDGSLDSIIHATQQTWLRNASEERWHMPSSNVDTNIQLKELLDQLGFSQEIKPTQTFYDHVLVLGDTVNGMRARFAYALDLWSKGIRFDTLTILASERPRFKDDHDMHDGESESILYDRSNHFLKIKKNWRLPVTPPATEAEIAYLIVDQTELPESLQQQVLISILSTPLQRTSSNVVRRPNTGDTFVDWLQRCKPTGSVLALSNQPYVGYQHAVLRSYAPENLTVETAGPKPSHHVPVHLSLDTLARWLYQERILFKK